MNTGYDYITDIYYTIRETDGAQVKAVTKFTYDREYFYQSHAEPNLAQLPGGRALLTWECHAAWYYNDICYAVLDSAGNSVKWMTNASGTSTPSLNVDADVLSNGNSVIAWREWQNDRYNIAYTVLDSDYNVLLRSPVILSNPAAVTGDGYISVTADSAGHAILTWMDTASYYRHNLYYALIDHYGIDLTDPMIFRTSQAYSPYIISSYAGYGNASYSWTPSSGVDGVAAFGASLLSGLPGAEVAMNVRYANQGATTATGVVLTATLAGGLNYLRDTLGLVPTVSDNDVIWNLPDLDFLDSRRFTLYVQMPSGTGTAQGGRYPVTLTLNSDGPETNPENNTDRAEVMFAQQVFLPRVR